MNKSGLSEHYLKYYFFSFSNIVMDFLHSMSSKNSILINFKPLFYMWVFEDLEIHTLSGQLFAGKWKIVSWEHDEWLLFYSFKQSQIDYIPPCSQCSHGTMYELMLHCANLYLFLLKLFLCLSCYSNSI